MAVTAGVVKTTSPMSRRRTSRIFIAGRRNPARVAARACERCGRVEQFDAMTRRAALVVAGLLVAPVAAAAPSAGGATCRRAVGHSVLRVHSRPTPRIARPDPAGARRLSPGGRGRSEERGDPAEIATLNARANRTEDATRAARQRAGHRPGERRRALGARHDHRRRARRARRGRPRRDRGQADARRRHRAPRAGAPEPAARRHAGADARPPLSGQAATSPRRAACSSRCSSASRITPKRPTSSPRRRSAPAISRRRARRSTR